jgi:hypothetical protein
VAYCKYCGKKYNDQNAKFCAGCGKSKPVPVNTNIAGFQPPPLQTLAQHKNPQSDNIDPSTGNADFKLRKKKRWIPVAAIALVLAIGLSVMYISLGREPDSTRQSQNTDEEAGFGEAERQTEPETQGELQNEVYSEAITREDPQDISAEPPFVSEDQEDSQGEDIEDVLEPGLRDSGDKIMETLYLYYTTYLDCLNTQSSAPLRGVTDDYDITAWINNNQAYQFDFTAVVIDMDSLQYTEEINAQIHLQFQYQYRRRGAAGSWTNTSSTQVCYLIYDSLSEAWLIREIIINDNLVLGNNQIVLDHENIND